MRRRAGTPEHLGRLSIRRRAVPPVGVKGSKGRLPEHKPNHNDQVHVDHACERRRRGSKSWTEIETHEFDELRRDVRPGSRRGAKWPFRAAGCHRGECAPPPGSRPSAIGSSSNPWRHDSRDSRFRMKSSELLKLRPHRLGGRFDELHHLIWVGDHGHMVGRISTEVAPIRGANCRWASGHSSTG